MSYYCNCNVNFNMYTEYSKSLIENLDYVNTARHTRSRNREDVIFITLDPRLNSTEELINNIIIPIKQYTDLKFPDIYIDCYYFIHQIIEEIHTYKIVRIDTIYLRRYIDKIIDMNALIDQADIVILPLADEENAEESLKKYV